jgi:hypothetical protein
MSESFNAGSGLIIVRAELDGTLGTLVLRMALDTGAAGTLVSETLLTALGYSVATAKAVRLATGSGVVGATRLPVSRFAALGHERRDFPVIAHNLPPSVHVHGLLGLDYLRGLKLSIDFQSGRITLD